MPSTVVKRSARTVVTLPGAPPMMAWSFVGRFGFGMMNLSVLLFVRAETGSYAMAGAISAASLVGTAAGTLVQGRVIDRYGPTRPFLALAAPHAILGTAVVAGIAASIPAAAVALVIAAQSAVLPSVVVASRTMWPHLIPGGPDRDAAYNYEAISFELCWLLGPAVAGLLATLLWPGTALLVALLLVTVAPIGFASTRVVRANRGQSGAAHELRGARGDLADGHGGAIHRAGLATLLAAASGLGLAIGFVVVGVISGTAESGAPELAGVLLAVWSVSAIVGGLAHGRRPWPRQPHTRLPVLMIALGTVLLIPAVLGDVVALTAMIVLTGLTLVPQMSTQNSLLDGLVPSPRLTEAYGWITTIIVMTNAAGQAAGGFIIEARSHRTSFLAATACVLFLAAVVWSRRRSLPGAEAGAPSV